MYDAPQCKVLIAGQSYMKCMELKRMLNWAEEGFRVILEQNIPTIFLYVTGEWPGLFLLFREPALNTNGTYG